MPARGVIRATTNMTSTARKKKWWTILLCFLVCAPVNAQQVGSQTPTESQRSQNSNPKANTEEIEKLITQLGNRNFASREAASKTLEDLALIALPALRK